MASCPAGLWESRWERSIFRIVDFVVDEERWKDEGKKKNKTYGVLAETDRFVVHDVTENCA